MQQQLKPNNRNTQPPPRVIPPRRSPRLLAEAYPNIKEEELPIMEETSNNGIKTQQAKAYNTRSILSFRSFTQEAILECVEIKQLNVTPDNFWRRKSPIQMINAVLDE